MSRSWQDRVLWYSVPHGCPRNMLQSCPQTQRHLSLPRVQLSLLTPSISSLENGYNPPWQQVFFHFIFSLLLAERQAAQGVHVWPWKPTRVFRSWSFCRMDAPR